MTTDHCRICSPAFSIRLACELHCSRSRQEVSSVEQAHIHTHLHTHAHAATDTDTSWASSKYTTCIQWWSVAARSGCSPSPAVGLLGPSQHYTLALGMPASAECPVPARACLCLLRILLRLELHAGLKMIPAAGSHT